MVTFTKSKDGFEGHNCGRCGGSGHYSFNLIHGTRCFGCGGTGFVLSKRGRVAKNLFEASLMVRADSLKPGDLVKADRRFSRVESVSVVPNSNPQVYNGEPIRSPLSCIVVCGECTWHCGGPETLVRKGFTGEEKAPLLAAALAYQETLTANGTVRKVR